MKTKTFVQRGLDALNNKTAGFKTHPPLAVEKRQQAAAVERFCGILKGESSLTKALLEERKKDFEIEEKKN